MSEKTCKILDGPSREELFDSLRLFSEKRAVPFMISFSAELTTEFSYLISAIEAGDGSAHSWNIKLTAWRDYPQQIEEDMKKNNIIHAYYSTKHRKGTITFKSKN